jgi:hypothetical protein
MTPLEPHDPETPGGVAGGPSQPDRSDRPVDGPLPNYRGGTVDVDRRRAGQVVIGVCLVALVVTGVVLLVAAINNNRQINSLRNHGVPVTVAVTNCLGLMGGTGQQAAGYSCSGTYSLDGVSYHQTIPGTAFHAPGSTIQGVAVPGDPKLLTTPGQLARQHASWTAFIIPALLLLAAAVLVVGYVRRSGSATRPTPDGTAITGPR